MPLSSAFANPVGKKLHSINEEEDLDDVLAIHRSRSNHSKKQGNRSSSTSLSTAQQSPNVSHSKEDHRSSMPRTNLPDYTSLAVSIQQIVEAQQMQQRDAKVKEEILRSVQHDVRQLQASITSIERHNEDVAKSCDAIIENGEVSSNSLKIMAEEISNERIVSAKQKEVLEKEREALRKEKELLDVERERISRERTQLERSQALFEQRKIAAKEEIERADRTMPMIEEAEARLNDEMKRLTQLRDFVVLKDSKVQDELHRTEELSLRLEGMESSIKHDFEDAKRQQQEISEERLSLARERVSLLRERSKDKESHRLRSLCSQIS